MKATRKSEADMELTKKDVAEAIIKYTNHETSLAELVDWAEKAMMEANFETANHDLIRDIVGRLGLADVREFGLSWDDCYGFLNRLGYKVEVKASLAS